MVVQPIVPKIKESNMVVDIKLCKEMIKRGRWNKTLCELCKVINKGDCSLRPKEKKNG